MKQKYGVSEYELFRLGLDAAIGLGGRAAAAGETARRREQREAAQQERTGAQEASRLAATEALAELEPGKHVGGAEAFFASQGAPGAPSLIGGQRFSIGSLGPPAEGGQPRFRMSKILPRPGILAPEDMASLEGFREPSQQWHDVLSRWNAARATALEEALTEAGWDRAEAPPEPWDPDAEMFGPLAKAKSLEEAAPNAATLRWMDEMRRRDEIAAATRAPLPSPQVQLTYQQGQRAAPGTGQTAVGATLASDMALDPAQTARQRAEIMAQYQAAQPTPQQRRASYIPTTLGEAQAMARSATTQEEMAIAMEHIDQLARAGSLEDAITGAHIRRAQEAALKGWRPPQGETARDRAQLANIRQRTETSRLSAEYTRERIAALRAKAAKDVAKGKRVVGAIRRSDRPSAVGDAYEAAVTWTEEYEGFDKKTGEWSDDAILEEIRIVDPEAAEHATPEMIDTRRNSKWRSKVGQFADKTPDTIAAAVQRSMPKRRDQKLAQEAKRMVGNVGARYKASAKAASSLEATEARERIKNSARQDILRFKATLPTTGERTGATRRRGRINEKLASARASLTAAVLPDAKVYYEEYIRNLEGLLTQPVAAPVSAAPTTPPPLVRGDDGVWRRP
jgi:hypothetical protein